MKKTIVLLVLATLLGVKLNAETTRFYVVNETWNGASLLKAHIWGVGVAETTFPGISMTRMGEENVHFIDIENAPETFNMIVSNCNPDGGAKYDGDANQTVNITVSKSTPVIYVYGSGDGKRSVSSVALTYKLVRISGGNIQKVYQMELTDGKFVGTIDLQNNSYDGHEYFIAPKYSLFNSDSRISWSLIYRPHDMHTSIGFTTVAESSETGRVYNENWSQSSWKLTARAMYTFTFRANQDGTNPYFSITPHFDKTIGSEGYSTFSYTNNVAIPDGVDVYYANKATETSVSLTKVTASNGIPADAGVIIKGTAGAQAQFTPQAEATTLSGNLLSGSGAEGTDITANDFILGGTGDDFGFHQVSVAGKLGAYKAYLPAANVPGGAAKFSIVFDETNGIATLSHERTDNVYYDLQGRRVMNPTKGLFIVNGKKVIK